jgi:hypothetical protein
MKKSAEDLQKEWPEGGGYRQYMERRADGTSWMVTEHAYSVSALLLGEFWRKSKRAMERGEPPPELPAGILIEPPGKKEPVVCVQRTETRFGVLKRDSDGRVFEYAENGMVYRVNSRGERIVDPSFRRKNPASPNEL